MSHIVEVDEEGSLHLSADLLERLMGQAEPHTKYVLAAENGNLLLTRLNKNGPLWPTATSEERAEAFRKWAASHKDGYGLSDEAISRESIYD